MKKSNNTNLRILAVYPNSRGFGFAVLEGPDRLVDWGVVYVRANNHRRCLKKVKAIIERLQPDRLVTDDPRKALHRGVRIRRLLTGILHLAADLRIPRTGLSRNEVRRVVAQSNATTKQAIAKVIADQL